MKNFGIETKIILSVVLFAIIVSGIERYRLTSSVTEQFIESEQSRNSLLINTISPIIILNMSLELIESNNEYLNEIMKQNPDILKLVITRNDKTAFYENSTKNFSQYAKEASYLNRALIDTFTNEHLGSIELVISNERYIKFVDKNTFATLEIFLITFILLMIFIYIIKLEFKSFKKLSKDVLAYDPKKNNFPLDKPSREDEVGVIHNSIINMVEKINTHTQQLDEFNNSLEVKIKSRTLSLTMANLELNEYKSDLEKKVKKAIEEKEKANLLLSQQSKMASLGEMLASISHQWKQPLSIISNSNIALKLDNELESTTYAQIVTATTTIDDQIQFMTQTLRDFSDFFKPDKTVVCFSPKEAIEDIVRLFGKEYVAQGITIDIKQSPENEKLIILNFLNEFKQVILNILSNAKDAILENSPNNKEIFISISVQEHLMQISIQDYAGGIAADVIGKIFDPYLTTKASDKGTGIGLFMSKRIIEESMHGKIVVKNNLGGAQFLILLPYNKEECNV